MITHDQARDLAWKINVGAGAGAACRHCRYHPRFFCKTHSEISKAILEAYKQGVTDTGGKVETPDGGE